MEKLYKVCNADREKIVLIAACHLNQLIDTAKHRLGLEGDSAVTLVLEQDGTEIDEEDYFQSLQCNTAFILLDRNQTWIPPNHRSTRRLSLGTVSDDELWAIVDLPLEKLKDLLAGESLQEASAGQEYRLLKKLKDLLPLEKNDAEAVQEACQRHLDDRDRFNEAVQLLNLCNRYINHN